LRYFLTFSNLIGRFAYCSSFIYDLHALLALNLSSKSRNHAIVVDHFPRERWLWRRWEHFESAKAYRNEISKRTLG